MFRFTYSLFLLEGTLDAHFENYAQEVADNVRNNMYVEDLATGGESINKGEKLNSDPISLI